LNGLNAGIFSEIKEQDGSMVFSDKKQAPKKRVPSAHESSVTILTPGCHFNGKLFCRGASRIGGRIEGEVVSEGMLIIEEEAFVTADVRADEAIIQGTVEGKLTATSRVELSATSRFDGDIFTPCLIINEGAQFNGRCTMIDGNAAGLPKVEHIHKGPAVRDHAGAVRSGPDIGVSN
jgi:cytoskeletal protein CcmA (bactofilin family)